MAIECSDVSGYVAGVSDRISSPLKTLATMEEVPSRMLVRKGRQWRCEQRDRPGGWKRDQHRGTQLRVAGDRMQRRFGLCRLRFGPDLLAPQDAGHAGGGHLPPDG